MYPSFLPLPLLVNTLPNRCIANVTPSACNGDNLPSFTNGSMVDAASFGTGGAETDDRRADSTAGDVWLWMAPDVNREDVVGLLYLLSSLSLLLIVGDASLTLPLLIFSSQRVVVVFVVLFSISIRESSLSVSNISITSLLLPLFTWSFLLEVANSDENVHESSRRSITSSEDPVPLNSVDFFVTDTSVVTTADVSLPPFEATAIIARSRSIPTIQGGNAVGTYDEKVSMASPPSWTASSAVLVAPCGAAPAAPAALALAEVVVVIRGGSGGLATPPPPVFAMTRAMNAACMAASFAAAALLDAVVMDGPNVGV
mmetsp:Transcript_8224/g.15024  ORF Transcript_8224/g.15024 Transcript_8224/m.15024 type:complete len:314 (-) Transcript_8224:213-1154(-)